MNAYKKLLISSFDFSGYDMPEADTLEKQVATAYSIFLSEMGWQLEAPHNKPMVFVCQEWLQGLASACTVLFYNSEILQWAKENNLLPANASEKKEDAFLASYWPTMASNLATMFKRSQNGYKIV